MKRTNFTWITAMLFLLISCKREQDLKTLINQQLEYAVTQYQLMSKAVEDDTLQPRTIDSAGRLVSVTTPDWTSGFYPGILWYLYEYTGDTTWRNRAIRKTALQEKEQYNRWTHDLGFMLYCSYGNGLRLTGDTSYLPVLLNGARSLCSRYNYNVCLIRSWDHGNWQYPVIIDNMMNLEYLFWAFHQSNDSGFLDIALNHANNTIRNHYRSDFSTWHVVSYDTLTGKPVEKVTAQGYSDSSSWARGQSWGLYGFTMMYRETQDKKYLKQAEEIARFLIHHPRLAEDKIPYWDYDAPDIPSAKRDASAAAIMASALVELSSYTDSTRSAGYLKHAEAIIRSLSSPAYLAPRGTNGNFLLMHSVGSIPHKSEIDVPLIYADYYYIEALLRFKRIVQ